MASVGLVCPVCSRVGAGCLGIVGERLHCLSADHAGAIKPQEWKGQQAYAHRQTGKCACGVEHRLEAPKGNGAEHRSPTPRPGASARLVGGNGSTHDHEVERAVLGALLLVPERLAGLELAPSTFDLPRHAIVFAAMARVEKLDATTLVDELRRSGHLEKVGGLPFIGALLDYPTPALLDTHAEKLKGMALRRALAAHAERVQMRANEGLDSPEELRAFTERSLREVEALRDDGGTTRRTPEQAFAASAVTRFRAASKPLSWVVDKLIPEKAVGLLAGAGGCGKGHLLQQLGVSCSIGRQFGPFHVKQRCGVLYVSWEDDSEELHRRYEAALHALWLGRVDPDDLHDIERRFHQVDVCGLGMQLDRRLIDLVKRRVEGIEDCRLIVLDPLVRLLPPLDGLSINSQEGAGRVHELLGQLQVATGCSILVAHHDSKAGRGAAIDDANAASGSAQLVDLARFSMRMKALDDEAIAKRGLDHHARYVELGLAKANRGPGIGESVVWRRQSGGALTYIEVRSQADLDLAATADALADLGQATQAQWLKASGLSKHRFQAAKTTLMAAGNVIKTIPNGGRRTSNPVYELRHE